MVAASPQSGRNQSNALGYLQIVVLANRLLHIVQDATDLGTTGETCLCRNFTKSPNGMKLKCVVCILKL